MSGETELDKKLAQTERDIFDYQSSVGLPKSDVTDWNEIESYLSLTREQMSKMTRLECAEIVVMLSQAAFYVQKQHNIETAKKHWAEHELTRLVAKHIDQYDKFMAYEIKRAKVINDNEALHKIYRFLLEANKRSDSLYLMASQIKFIASALEGLEQVKRENNGPR